MPSIVRDESRSEPSKAPGGRPAARSHDQFEETKMKRALALLLPALLLGALAVGATIVRADEGADDGGTACHARTETGDDNGGARSASDRAGESGDDRLTGRSGRDRFDGN